MINMKDCHIVTVTGYTKTKAWMLNFSLRRFCKASGRGKDASFPGKVLGTSKNWRGFIDKTEARLAQRWSLKFWDTLEYSQRSCWYCTNCTEVKTCLGLQFALYKLFYFLLKLVGLPEILTILAIFSCWFFNVSFFLPIFLNGHKNE